MKYPQPGDDYVVIQWREDGWFHPDGNGYMPEGRTFEVAVPDHWLPVEGLVAGFVAHPDADADSTSLEFRFFSFLVAAGALSLMGDWRVETIPLTGKIYHVFYRESDKLASRYKNIGIDRGKWEIPAYLYKGTIVLGRILPSVVITYGADLNI